MLGEGERGARLMLVGEQPGDREDIEGRPFVGPAGRILDQGLDRAGIDRASVYVTNTVKHFRYKARGKRRIHQTPERAQVIACAPWLDAELRIVAPEALVCLGATAARALLGSQVRNGCRYRPGRLRSGCPDTVDLPTDRPTSWGRRLTLLVSEPDHWGDHDA